MALLQEALAERGNKLTQSHEEREVTVDQRIVQYEVHEGEVRKEAHVLSILNSLAIAVLLATSVWAQQPQEIPAAPVPGQIGSAKKVFISNAGEETIFRLPKDALFRGGPNRAYNQFYAAMKSWGRYELLPAPADADLVFAIGFTDRNAGPILVDQFKLVILDPKTGVALWTITKYVEPAGLAKNREKNYDATMMDLMEDVKSIVTPATPASSN